MRTEPNEVREQLYQRVRAGMDPRWESYESAEDHWTNWRALSQAEFEEIRDRARTDRARDLEAARQAQPPIDPWQAAGMSASFREDLKDVRRGVHKLLNQKHPVTPVDLKLLQTLEKKLMRAADTVRMARILLEFRCRSAPPDARRETLDKPKGSLVSVAIPTGFALLVGLVILLAF